MNIYLKWFLRAWPVLIPLLILTAHLTLIISPCINSFLCLANSEINKYLSFLLQLIGGYLILRSIDSNIQLFKNENIKHLFVSWVQAFPNKGVEPLDIYPESSGLVDMSSNPRIVIPPNPDKPREVVSYFLNEIEVLNDKFFESKKEVAKLEAQLSYNAKEQSKVNRDVSGIIKEITVGGLKPQLFGLILVFYGAVISLFA